MTAEDLIEAGWACFPGRTAPYWRPPHFCEIDGKPHYFSFENACLVESLNDPTQHFVDGFLAEEARLEYNRRREDLHRSGQLPRQGFPPNY